MFTLLFARQDIYYTDKLRIYASKNMAAACFKAVHLPLIYLLIHDER
jgi:hypothetical protein